MKRLFGTTLAAASVAATATFGVSGAAAKTCGGRYVHGVIGGHQKCLAVKEFCARSHRRQYLRYGFVCKHEGRYWRLEYR